MRFHVLGIPTTASNNVYVSCAFTQGIIHFCKMMKWLNHYVIHYGHEDSKVDCDEMVNITTDEDLIKWYGKDYIGKQDWKQKGFSYNGKDECHVIFYQRVYPHLIERITTGDFVCIFDGNNAVPLVNTLYRDIKIRFFVTEPQIGYCGSFTEFRVFTSNALRVGTMILQKAYKKYNEIVNEISKTSEKNNKNVMTIKQNQFDLHKFSIDEKETYKHTVIPYCIDKEDFTLTYSMVTRSQKLTEPFLLFIARQSLCKGLHLIIYAAELANKKLIVAGPGGWELPSVGGNPMSVQKAYSIIKANPYLYNDELDITNTNINVPLLDPPSNVTFVGFADFKKRKELLHKCEAVVAYPTYEEPFGKISIEALICGKPLITSARGGYTEVIEDGKTGFLCRTLEELVYAMNNVHTIKKEDCLASGEKYTLQNTFMKYEKYYQSIYNREIKTKKGWFSV